MQNRRNLLEKPEKITQGTIFSNAKSLHFDENVYGLIISARCDIENSHFHTYLYLPIIDLKDWFYKILVPRVCKEELHEIKNKIEKCFLQKNLSMNVLKYVNKELLLKEHFNKKELEIFNNYERKMELYNKLFDDTTNRLEIMKQMERKEREIFTSQINILEKNNLAGYFYLENVDYYEQKSNRIGHYVIIQNEVQSLPHKIVNELGNGIDLVKNHEYKDYFGKDNYSLAISTITSPYIECIIQYYTSLFRIGIDRGIIDSHDFLFMEDTK
jgi:hypothetical protein